MIKRFLILFIKFLSSPRVFWLQDNLSETPKVYFVNHSSHLDFVVIWSVLPSFLRDNVCPVAAKEYWEKGKVRRYLAKNIFNAILIDREKVQKENNPIQLLSERLQKNKSIIIFPEGTRNLEGKIGPFKSGIYHLAKSNLNLEFIPVYLENLNRILPKGEFLPIPMLCSVRFGKIIKLRENESKQEFMERAKNALEELKEL